MEVAMTQLDIVLFDGFETVDAMGPAEVFGRLPGGMGTRSLIHDAEYIAELKQRCEAAPVYPDGLYGFRVAREDRTARRTPSDHEQNRLRLGVVPG
jgi:hypothetical protein